MNDPVTRRNLIKTAAGAGAIALAGGKLAMAEEQAPSSKGRIRQSVCEWCFNKKTCNWTLDELCQNARKLGLVGIDLMGPDDFPTLKKYDLIGTMTRSHPLTDGLARKEYWDMCFEKIRYSIDKTADAGAPNVICFSGNRKGMGDEEGLENCTAALKQVIGQAEQKKVTLQMELLNSIGHKDYMCDHTKWGVELVKRVGSERFKLLYDIYHMQIMEGNIIDTIRRHKDAFGHYHTAGVPGRHELDDTQELQYAPIMRAIADTGFKGFVAQEFTPTKDAYASLQAAVKVCDV